MASAGSSAHSLCGAVVSGSGHPPLGGIPPPSLDTAPAARDGAVLATAQLNDPALVSTVNFDDVPYSDDFIDYMASVGYVDNDQLLVEQTLIDQHELLQVFPYDIGDLEKDLPSGSLPPSLSGGGSRPWHWRHRSRRRRAPPGSVDGGVVAAHQESPEPIVLADQSVLQVHHCGTAPVHLLRSMAYCDVASDLHSVTDAVPPSSSPSDDWLALDQALSEVAASVRALHGLPDIISAEGWSVHEFYNSIHGQDTEDVCAHLDGGAQGSTTDQLEILDGYTPVPRCSKHFRVADGTIHIPDGYGFAQLRLVSGQILRHRVWYTPSLPATIFSSPALGREHGCGGYSAVVMFDSADKSTLRLLHCRTAAPGHLDIECTLRDELSFSASLLLPSAPSSDIAMVSASPESDAVASLATNGSPSSAAPSGACCSPCSADAATDPSVGSASCSHPASGLGSALAPDVRDSPPLCKLCCPHCEEAVDPPSAAAELLTIQRLGFLPDADLHATGVGSWGLPRFQPRGYLYSTIPGKAPLLEW